MVYIMFNFERKKRRRNIFTVVVSDYGKALTIVTKCSVLDVAGVLNLPQYVLSCIAYRNNLIQVADGR